MKSVRVVEAFDGTRDGILGLSSCWPAPAIDELRLQCTEETLCDSVVLTVALAAHGAEDTVLIQHGLVRLGRVLNPAVRIMHQPLFRQTTSQGHVKRFEGKLRSQVRLHRPANDATREQVDELVRHFFVDPVVGFEHSQQPPILQRINKRWICGLVLPIHVVR